MTLQPNTTHYNQGRLWSQSFMVTDFLGHLQRLQPIKSYIVYKFENFERFESYIDIPLFSNFSIFSIFKKFIEKSVVLGCKH